MDPTPSSSTSSFDVVGRALEDFIPERDGAAAADGPAGERGSAADGDTGPRAGRRAGREAASGAAPGAGDDADDAGNAGNADDQEDILGAVSLDRDLRIVSCNLAAAPFAGLSPVPGDAFTDLLPPTDVPTVTARLRKVVETRRAHVARVQRLRRDDGSDLVVSLSILPAAAPDDGLTVSLIAMAKRLHLYASATAIGTSLDIGETAQSLARSLLPWGDVAAVDLDFAVWTGEAVGESVLDPIRLRRAALVPDRPWPAGYLTPGDNLPREASRLLAGAVTRNDVPETIVLPDRESIARTLGDLRLVRALVPAVRPLSLVCIPLVVEGPEGTAGPVVLGVAEIWRRSERPLGSGDLMDLQELVARTARHVDLARVHQREHAQVLALQRRLLPRAGGDTIQVAGVYQPTTPDSAGVGGDWATTFPLPDGRTALVAGDVVGHGLGAAAAMGQLSMEARALLSAGLGPGQVLACLDETVTLLDDADAGLAAGYSALGSTCCIVVYDPVENRCLMSSAGHLPPVLVHPDRSARIVTPKPHPGLGAAFAIREPFEEHEFAAPPGSLLALYTDGLVEDPVTPIDEGIEKLADAVREVHSWDELDQAARRVVAGLVPEGALRDDVTLLLARLAGRRTRDTATWRLAARPEAAGRARRLVGRQLSLWHLGDQVRDNAVLVVGELVTNAVRFGTGPVMVRLVRADGRVVCEVGDSGNGRPHLRRPAPADDSGRGLLLVHKLTTRWGVRWAADGGKVVWTELAE